MSRVPRGRTERRPHPVASACPRCRVLQAQRGVWRSLWAWAPRALGLDPRGTQFTGLAQLPTRVAPGVRVRLSL